MLLFYFNLSKNHLTFEFGSENGLHHQHELLKVYFAVTIFVHLPDSLIQLLFGIDSLELITAEKLANLFAVNLP